MRIGIAAGLLLMLALLAPAAARDVRYANPVVAGVRAHVVIVDLKSARVEVRPVLAYKKTFASMARGTIAAINGTFFDPRSYNTLGSVVSNGKVLHHGYIGNALAVDRGLRPHFLKVNRKSIKAVDWTPYVFAITTGPTLVYKGRVALNPRAEGFRDPRLYRRAQRSAIGIRDNGELLLVTVPRQISLGRLARIMRDLKSVYALNLDGGSSSGLYYRGKMITRPRRKITNIVAVVNAVR